MELNPSKLLEYKIVSALDEEMVLANLMDEISFLILEKWHSKNHQIWNIQDIGNRKFIIINVMSSKVMSGPIDLHQEGWFIKCSIFKESLNQIWEMIPCVDEKFKEKHAFFIKNSHSGKVLDVEEAKAKNGQSIIEWEMKKDEKIKSKLNQIWIIEPVSFISEKKSLYKIFSAADYGLVLDASKGETNENSLILYSCHKGNNQKFQIETVKGKYILINKDKDLSLTVEGKEKGAKVKVNSLKKEENELWELIPCKKKEYEGKKAYHIKSSYGFYLDAINEKVISGAEIVQSEFTGNESQVWIFLKI